MDLKYHLESFPEWVDGRPAVHLSIYPAPAAEEEEAAVTIVMMQSSFNYCIPTIKYLLQQR